MRRVLARSCPVATSSCRRGVTRPHNTGDKLRSSIACAGFVCFIPLLGGFVFHSTPA
jgi:hypothetical protein